MLLATVLIAQPADSGQSEATQLNIRVFDDFAQEIAGESGFRLEIDNRLRNRPVVFWIGSELSPLDVLRRACTDLDVGCNVDEKLKKVVMVPLVSKDVNRAQILLEEAINFAQRELAPYVNADAKAIEAATQRVRGEAFREDLTGQESAVAEARLTLFSFYSKREDRILMSQILGENPKALARAIATAPTNEILMPLNDLAKKEWEILAKNGPTPSFDFGEEKENEPEEIREVRAIQQARKRQFELCLSERPDIQIWLGRTTDGGIFARLKLVGDSLTVSSGFISLPVPTRLEIEIDESAQKELSVAKKSTNKPLIYGGVIGNQIATPLIGTKKSSVSWLQDYQFSTESLKMVNATDGWVQIYDQMSRYPLFHGNWRGLIELFALREKNGFELPTLAKWIKGKSPSEVREMDEALRDVRLVRYKWRDLVDGINLVQAAAFEFDLSKIPTKSFKRKVGELSLEARKSVHEMMSSRLVREEYPQLLRQRNRAKWDDFTLSTIVEQGEDDQPMLVVWLITTLEDESGDPLGLYAVVPLATD